MAETKTAGPLLEWRKKKVQDLKGLERRTFSTEGMELREADDGSLHLSGYACVTGVAYEVGWYTETIERGAFKRTLSESPDVQLLINHTGMPIARTKSGTLELAEDERGLKVDADLDPEDPDVKSLARKMGRGDIDMMSFAFQQTAQDWNEDYTDRKILACSIHRGDVSVVNQGANPATLASIRSADAIAALADLGSPVVLAAFVEWRDYTLVPREQRAGKALSAATMEVLTQVLNLVAAADEAVDEAQPLLAELMGVPNPDEPEPDAVVESEADVSTRAIVDSGDLRNAIRAVIRTPGRDEQRAKICERARELGIPGLLPDCWDWTSGELRAGCALATQEQRETYNDLYQGLSAAVDDAFEDYWTWVCDFTDTEVIFSAGGELWSAPYSVEAGGPITIGERVGVRPVTEYVPTGETERAAPATETQALPDFTTRAAQEYELLMLREGVR
jgi:HK97 family phage prohead protease